jgi:uncharacterized membrane protein YqjE
MPSSARSDAPGEPLPDAVRKLSRDGAAWVQAEAELAQAELAEASKRALKAVALALLAGSVALAALVLTAFGLAMLLLPLTGSPFLSITIVAVVLIIGAGLLGLWAWRTAVSTTEVTTFVKRWSDALFARKRRAS